MPSEFQSFLEDLFAPLGGVSFRRMFGGLGVYRDGIMFALVAEDVLYLKTDEAGRTAFAAEGCAPFQYDARGKSVTMSYWQLPERLYDEPDEFRDWALVAIGVAERTKAPPRKAKAVSSVKAGKGRAKART